MSELIPNKTYKCLCGFFTPNGIIQKGSKYTGKQWAELLVYQIDPGNISKMFEEISE